MINNYKYGDPIKNAQWIVTLAKKMDKLEVDYVIATRPRNFEEDSRACMRVYDNHSQKRPEVFLGYQYAKFDNLYGVITLMHEIGHTIDYKKCSNSMFKYYRTYGTIEMEIRAWENAFRIAREVGFTDYDSMLEFGKACLGTYFDSLESRPSGKLRNDVVCNFMGVSPKRPEGMERLETAHKEAKRAYVREFMGV